MVKTKLVKEQPVRSMAKNANNLLTHSSLKVSIQTNKQMTNPFLKLDFLFEFCFSLHGMQYVLLSHTGKYYFNFSGMAAWYHIFMVLQNLFLYINCTLFQIVYPKYTIKTQMNVVPFLICCCFSYLHRQNKTEVGV